MLFEFVHERSLDAVHLPGISLGIHVVNPRTYDEQIRLRKIFPKPPPQIRVSTRCQLPVRTNTNLIGCLRRCLAFSPRSVTTPLLSQRDLIAYLPVLSEREGRKKKKNKEKRKNFIPKNTCKYPSIERTLPSLRISDNTNYVPRAAPNLPRKKGGVVKGQEDSTAARTATSPNRPHHHQQVRCNPNSD